MGTRTDRVVDAIGRRTPELFVAGLTLLAVWVAPWWFAALVATPLVWVLYTEYRPRRGTEARTAAARGGSARRIAAVEPADKDEPGEGERSA